MKRILLVDDEPELLEVCQLVLEYEGYDTAIAHGGQHGISQARLLQPDLIIVDWVMPDLTGGEVVRQLKQDRATARIPILMMSALGEVQTEAQILGASGFIAKPFDVSKFLQEVVAIVGRGEKAKVA